MKFEIDVEVADKITIASLQDAARIALRSAEKASSESVGQDYHFQDIKDNFEALAHLNWVIKYFGGLPVMTEYEEGSALYRNRILAP